MTVNPFEMIGQFIPPAMQRKIMAGLCMAACLALFIFMFPMILSNLVAKMITG